MTRRTPQHTYTYTYTCIHGCSFTHAIQSWYCDARHSFNDSALPCSLAVSSCSCVPVSLSLIRLFFRPRAYLSFYRCLFYFAHSFILVFISNEDTSSRILDMQHIIHWQFFSVFAKYINTLLPDFETLEERDLRAKWHEFTVATIYYAHFWMKKMQIKLDRSSCLSKIFHVWRDINAKYVAHVFI